MPARVSNLIPNPERTLARFSISLARRPSQSLSTFAIFFIDAPRFRWFPSQISILTPDSCPKNIRVLGRLQLNSPGLAGGGPHGRPRGGPPPPPPRGFFPPPPPPPQHSAPP